MDFKLLSKNNIGVVSALILVILLSQARVFDFLIDTSLGMFILIIFILGISYMNNNLGLVAVLLIIIIMNQNDSGYLEGFNIKNIGKNIQNPTTPTPTSTPPSNKNNSNASTSDESTQKEVEAKKASNNADVAKKAFESAKRAMDQANSAAVNAAAAQKAQAEQRAAQAKAKEEQAQAAYKAAQQSARSATQAAMASMKKPKSKESFVGGREGFNMIDREGTILKGKRSNEIPVLYNSRSQSDDDVEPMDNSMFKNSFSLF
jgi:pyruvate/2-oxoglutarate dehydrogenase complex dihydrolipoamide acyltransferase (E2) component